MNIKDEFEMHCYTWRNDTEHLFKKRRAYIFDHPSYQEIINLGKEVVPLILEKIKGDGSKLLWHIALERITGENHAEKDATTNEEKNADWLRWGQEQGLID